MWIAALLLADVASGPWLIVRDPLVPAEAIVVIGGDHKPARIRRAADLYAQGYAPVVILSAGTIVHEGDQWIPEAAVMYYQALEAGVPAEAIVLELTSQSTVENATYSGQICRRLGIDSILLVTSAHHSRRARRIFLETLAPEVQVSVQPADPRGCAWCWWLYPDQVYVVAYEHYHWLGYYLSESFKLSER